MGKTTLESLRQRSDVEERKKAREARSEVFTKLGEALVKLEEFGVDLEDCKKGLNQLETLFGKKQDLQAESRDWGEEISEEPVPVRVIREQVAKLEEQIDTYKKRIANLQKEQRRLDKIATSLSPKEQEKLAKLESSEALKAIMNDILDATRSLHLNFDLETPTPAMDKTDYRSKILAFDSFNEKVKRYLERAEQLYRSTTFVVPYDRTSEGIQKARERVQASLREGNREIFHELGDDPVLENAIHNGGRLNLGLPDPEKELRDQQEEVETTQRNVDRLLSLEQAIKTGENPHAQKLDNEDLKTILDTINVRYIAARAVLVEQKRRLDVAKELNTDPETGGTRLRLKSHGRSLSVPRTADTVLTLNKERQSLRERLKGLPELIEHRVGPEPDLRFSL